MTRCSFRKPAVMQAIGLIFALATATAARAEYFTITSFESQMMVQPDATLTVRERIGVAFTAARHGIYRDLPFRYTDDMGRKISTPLSVLSVSDDDGAAYPFTLSREGDTLRVRIGNPKRTVEGNKNYVIVYRVRNAILFLKDRDELYWNVTGNGWDTTIAEAVASVVIQNADGPLEFQTACYTGSYGATEHDCAWDATAKGARFYTTRGLKPREGMTVALGWKKGLVQPPGTMKKLLWLVNLRENWVLLLPFLALGFALQRWNATGRDPDVGPSTAVVFTPPEHGGRALIPVEIGTLVDEKLDQRDLTASMVQLAVRGYLSIEETEGPGIIFKGKDYFLKKLKDPDDALQPFEKELLGHLFGGEELVKMSGLNNRFYAHLPGLRKTVYQGLTGLGLFVANPEQTRSRWQITGVLVGVAGFFLTGILSTRFGTSPLVVIVAAALSAAVFLIFAPLMPARTRRGALLRNKIKGFLEFLNRAEKDRLERMADKNLFEKYLPYAIALGVSERWASAFEGIYQDPPRWYIGPTGLQQGFSPSAFNHSITGALSSVGAAMYSTPRGSGGSGGGGSSGGGFGGGGGGSW